MFVVITMVNHTPAVVFGPYENENEAREMKEYMEKNDPLSKHFVRQCYPSNW